MSDTFTALPILFGGLSLAFVALSFVLIWWIVMKVRSWWL